MLQRKAREKKNGLAVISRLQSPFFHVNPTVESKSVGDLIFNDLHDVAQGNVMK